MLYDEFWKWVDQSGGPDSCWPWMRCVTENGYGQLVTPTGRKGAHVVAYTLAGGVLANGQIVRHTCDRPPCCNPAHLLSGTHKQNRTDRTDRGRQGNTTPHRPQRGEDRPAAKLDEASVRRIRTSNDSVSSLARQYRVSRPVIRGVRNRTMWSHVI